MLVLEGHQAAVAALAFAPDGERLASAGKDGTVRIWSPPMEIAVLTGAEGALTCLAFSNNGKLIAAGGMDRTARVWNVEAPGEPQRMGSQTQPVTAIAFLQNDQQLVVGCGDPTGETFLSRSLFRWDLSTNKLIEAGLSETKGVRALVVLAEQRLLAYALDRRELVVRDLVKPTPVCAFSLRNNCQTLALSADGKWLAAGLDNYRIHVYDVARKTERFTMNHTGRVSSLAFSPDGRVLMSGSWDKTVRIWDAATGRERHAFNWPVGRVNAVAFAPDGLRAAAGGEQGAIAVWDVDF